MRLGRATAAAAVGIAVLAGCSNGETANETLPPATSSAAPKSDALQPLGPPDFPVPDEARQQSEAGALAAARYFLELTAYSYQAGDSTSIGTLSRQCEFCASLTQAIADDQSAGNKVTGGNISLEDAGQVVMKSEAAEVAFTVSQSPLTVTAPNGEQLPDRGQPAYRSFTSLALTWSEQSSAWIVNQVTVS